MLRQIECANILVVKRKMKKVLIIASTSIMAIMLTSCGTKVTYPHLEYWNSSYQFDISNKTILLEEGSVLDSGHPYDIEETKDGYDIVFHFKVNAH